jgi:hypothetical protein
MQLRFPYPRLNRRRTYIALGALVGCATVALSLGALIRAEVSAAAAKQRFEVSVGSVRPGWFAVVLRDVTVRPLGVSGVTANVEQVHVDLSIGLHVQRVDLRGGRISLTGKADALRNDIDRWLAVRASARSGAATQKAVSVVAESLSLRWLDGVSTEPRLECEGLHASRTAQRIDVALSKARMRLERGSVSVNDVTADFMPNGQLERAHAAAVAVEWAPARTDSSAIPTEVATSAPVVSITANAATRRLSGRTRASASPLPSATDSGAPFVLLPNLPRARGNVASAALLLGERFPEGATLTIDALTSTFPREGERVALAIGPGALALVRERQGFELRYSTDADGAARGPRDRPPGSANSPLSLRAVVPTGPGDVVVTLEGGPVSLSLLGIQEGAAGLVDVAGATLAGRARTVLSSDGTALSFDAEGGTRGLALQQPKLASDVVRGIDLQVRARGTVTSDGTLRIDDFGATMGSLRISGSGSLDQQPGRVLATLRFEVPPAGCESLLGSVPTALLPALEGTRLAGTFGARGHFAFDTSAPDDLDLRFDVADACRIVEVPAALARERFLKPFEHRIYLPDGSTQDETTGPESDNWTPLEEISPFMQVAVLTTEDGAFPRHHGFNHAAIRASIVANLKARAFVRGASTITMQLAKNLFLSREKTLSRKLQEIVLTDYLEQTFTKDELMELYLNVIEFGPGVYGITEAARHFFGRSPGELNLAESLFLASLLPSPIRLGAIGEAQHPSEHWMRTLHTLMNIARKTGLITDGELAEAQDEAVAFWHGGPFPEPRPPAHARLRYDGEDLGIIPPPFDIPAEDP